MYTLRSTGTSTWSGQPGQSQGDDKYGTLASERRIVDRPSVIPSSTNQASETMAAGSTVRADMYSYSSRRLQPQYAPPAKVCVLGYWSSIV